MVANMNSTLLYEIRGYHIGGYEDYALMECLVDLYHLFGSTACILQNICCLEDRHHVPQKHVVCLSDC
jgi:hypothetical protein